MGTKIRIFWTITCLASICLQCSLVSAEAPVTNYMSSYYDDAYHDEKGKSPSPPKSYYPRHESDTEEEDEEERPLSPHSHKPYPHRNEPKHHSHDEEEYGPHEDSGYHQRPPPKSNSYKPTHYGSYGPKSNPKSYEKPYGSHPKASYPPPTKGQPKYPITTSGPGYSGGNSRSASPKYTVGSFSSSTGPGYRYSYGTKVTEEGKEDSEKEPEEDSGPYRKYEESNAPKDSYNMNHMNTYKGVDEDSLKGGYTAGYPPINPYNTVKGNYDDYGHNDLSPKSPYKPSNKPVTFSYSAPISTAEYGAPVDSPAGGNSYDSEDHSYTTSGYEKPPYKKGMPSHTIKPSYYPFKGGPKHAHSSPPPKYQGPLAKYNVPPTKHYEGAKTPPSSTYATISTKSFGKSPAYSSYENSPPSKNYYPPSPSSNYGNYYSNKDYEYARSPSTSSVAKEYSPSSVSPGSYHRGSPPPRSTSTIPPSYSRTFGRGARTFVKTPEKKANGYTNSASYGGGYDMGTSYY